jgi:hypothetical protein
VMTNFYSIRAATTVCLCVRVRACVCGAVCACVRAVLRVVCAAPSPSIETEF